MLLQKTNTKNKKNFYLTVQYLEKYRSPVHQLVLLSNTRYIADVFILAFRHPELEIKNCTTILYRILYCKVHKRTATCRECMCVTTYAKRELTM